MVLKLHPFVYLMFVKGKVGDDDLAVAFKDGGRWPCDVAGVVQEHFGELDDGKVTICTTVGIKEEQGSKWQMNLQFCLGMLTGDSC